MDGERLGPLSYDVTAPEGETSAQRPIVVGAIVVVALMVLSLFGGWFVLGFVEAKSLVVGGAPLLIVGAALGAVLTSSRESVRRTRRAALVTVLALALLAALFTNRMLNNVKPAMPQIRASVDAIDLPRGFAVQGDVTYGDRLCRRGCPRLERTFSVPAGDPDPVATLILAMFDQGWQQANEGDPKLATVAVKNGLQAHLSPEDAVLVMYVTRQ